MSQKLQSLISILLILANLAFSWQVFAQTVPTTMTIVASCIPAQFTNIAELESINFPTVSTSANNQTSLGDFQGPISLTDNRTGAADCGPNPVTLTVQILSANNNFQTSTGRGFFNGSDDIFEPVAKNERAAALSAIQIGQPTCTGCTDFSHSSVLSATQALSANNDSDLNPANDGDKVAVLFNADHGFSGVATIPSFNYSLEIPAGVAPGSYQATLTYTLTP